MSPIEENDVECPFCGKAQADEIPGHHLIPGTILNDKYIVGAAIGEGGFGITYIGRDIKLDMKIAIKEYYPNGYVSRSNTISPTVKGSTSSDKNDFFDKGRERFLQEARILAKFSGSPGIVDVRDFFETNGTAYIVMEYLDGQTLKEFIKEKGTLTSKQTLSLLMPVMQSLQKVHKQGLIHRDISPDNIMILDEQVKLLDFGAARSVSSVSQKSLSVMLKPGYAPEEQYRSKGEQGPWTDVYALCATMYKCITGITPDDSTQRVFSDELKTPAALGISIEPDIEKTILKGLNVLQKDRFQNIDELLDGFKGIIKKSDDDEKTVYGGGMEVEDDDKETEYIGKSVGMEPSSQVTKPQSPSPKTTPEPISSKPVQPVNNTEKSVSKESEEIKPAESKSNKKIIIIVAAVLVGILVCVGIGIGVKSLGGNGTDNDKETTKETKDDDEKDEEETTKVYDEKDEEEATKVYDDDSLSFNEKIITADGMKKILQCPNLKYLYFTNCTFNEDVLEYIGDISSELKWLSFENCKGITDYSSISELKHLTELEIINCGLTNEQFSKIDLTNKEKLASIDLSDNPELSDIATIEAVGEVLYTLRISNTGIVDLSPLSNCGYLSYLYANGNGITDVAPLANLSNLDKLEISNNKITDITALSNLSNLTTLNVDNNEITTLEPLNNLQELDSVYVNNNKLTNLNGLEYSLSLNKLYAAQNQITDINGITNCTLLEEFNINDNEVEDISLLKKSAATLKKVYFNGNKVSDISALKGMAELQYLSFDNNEVTEIDVLKEYVLLYSISAENNEIKDIDALADIDTLEYVFLANNTIENMEALSQKEKKYFVIDLSNNNISDLTLSEGMEIKYFSIYNNPISSIDGAKKIKGNNFLLSYKDGMNFDGFKGKFTYFNIMDCPLDKQLPVKMEITGSEYGFGITYCTVEEAEQIIARTKHETITGTSAEE